MAEVIIPSVNIEEAFDLDKNHPLTRGARTLNMHPHFLEFVLF